MIFSLASAAVDILIKLTSVPLFQVSDEEAGIMNRPGFTGGQNSRRIAHYGTDTKEEDLEAVFP